MAEWLIHVAVVAEPYVVPTRDDWVSDGGNSVAIFAPAASGSPPFDKVAKGRGCVLAVVGGVAVGPSPTSKGPSRKSGGSIVDLTFATPSMARRVQGWKVEVDVETLSDHRYIRFDVSTSAPTTVPVTRSSIEEGPRWVLGRLDRELAEEAAIVEGWVVDAGPPGDVDAGAELLGASLTNTAISRAKQESWEEWLAILDRDPWGRPYRAVRRKLRPWAPPLTTTLEPQLVESVVQTLFPSRAGSARPVVATEEEEVLPVSEVELRYAAAKLRLKKTAPGLDGVPGRVLALALSELGSHVRALFTECLVQGRFPSSWKEGKLVLLRKDGRPADRPSAYRPIVLLGEMSKLFERVLVHRLAILTGHGCFGEYLFGVVSREPNAECHHCVGGIVDTARHTREECPAWAVPRAAVSTEIGADLSLPAMVRAMSGSEQAWRAVATFGSGGEGAGRRCRLAPDSPQATGMVATGSSVFSLLIPDMNMDVFS
ncbi:uncharacterized protein LOC126376805 [Pectinophora gossypiella]|uniref:uncharacterized protein LOC126376805 n=1 Tax=Pectinophora gossypiella TaxID=13191 RepID=UPI00214E10E0|nr:uncharacterized protein LOC126376805 [Pectinophora gossypiella]